jgi:hypothetical protein
MTEHGSSMTKQPLGRSQTIRALMVSVCCASLLALTGCIGGGTVAVQGKVMLDGKPLPAGVVAFLPEHANSRSTAMGDIGPDGTYTMRTMSGQSGVLPGHYKVTVNAAPSSTPAARSGIPRKYNDVSNTPLTMDVPSSGGYDLKLAR